MYTVAVKKDLIAQHYLIGGDWGAENDPHSHHYVIEVRLEAAELDQHGYLVDIVKIETELDSIIDYFGDSMLNDLFEFEGLNPSIERLNHQLLAASFLGFGRCKPGNTTAPVTSITKSLKRISVINAAAAERGRVSD